MKSANLRHKPSRHYAEQLSFSTSSTIAMNPIGTVFSPYVERFGCPRQPNVQTNTLGGGNLEGRLELTGLDSEKAALALRGLDGFSYMHCIYVCHLNTGWTPLIQPPRGPRVKQGVYATRSPHRPNMIGLSLLKIKRVDAAAGVVYFSGGDVINGTPVLDIKPFIPHYDAPFGKIRIGWLEGIDDIVGEPDALKYSGPAMSILLSPSRALKSNRERAASV